METIKKSKNDIGIEFLRIIGCLMVIAVHLHLDCWKDGVPDKSRILITCLCCDGVGVFWFICGAFLFKNNDYKKVLIRTFHNIVIPLVVFSVIIFYFRGILIDGLTLKESLYHSKSDYIAILNGIIGWYNPVRGIGHLWYLYVYILIMLAFPVLKYIVSEIDKDVKSEKIAVVIILGLFLLNDITNNVTLEFSHHTIRGMFPSALIVLLGHIIYKNRQKLKNKRWSSFIYLILFIVLNWIRMEIVYYKYFHNGDNTILVWYSLIGIVNVICLYLFVNGIAGFLNDSMIKHLGKLTFIVYLVHRPVLEKFQVMQVNVKLQNMFNIDNIYGEVLFTICYTLLVFLVSGFIAESIFGLQRIYRKLRFS